jgi:hypothetical protein
MAIVSTAIGAGCDPTKKFERKIKYNAYLKH